MTRAKTALERLSRDPAAQELARERELAAWNYERALELARQEGIAEGKAEGKAELLLRLLSLRFGAVTDITRDKILRASAERMDVWTERVLTGSSVEAILA